MNKLMLLLALALTCTMIPNIILAQEPETVVVDTPTGEEVATPASPRLVAEYLRDLTALEDAEAEAAKEAVRRRLALRDEPVRMTAGEYEDSLEYAKRQGQQDAITYAPSPTANGAASAVDKKGFPIGKALDEGWGWEEWGGAAAGLVGTYYAVDGIVHYTEGGGGKNPQHEARIKEERSNKQNGNGSGNSAGEDQINVTVIDSTIDGDLVISGN